MSRNHGPSRAAGLLLGVAADSFVRGRRARAAQRMMALAQARRPLTAGLMLGGALLGGVVVERLGRRHPLLRVAGTALATWTALGGAALAADGTATARALDASDLAGARAGLGRLSAHDPSTLDGVSVARVAVESVAENTSDAVVAPLLWGAMAGVPGLLGYQAVRALDGCSGWFGWVAARLEDVVDLVPSRATAALTAACAPVVGGSAAGAWEVWRRDGSAHPRPNHGQVEAAFAGALQVRLGGRTVYPHGVQERPVLGHGRTPDAGDLTRGVELSRVVGAAAAVVSAVVAVAVGTRRR